MRVIGLPEIVVLDGSTEADPIANRTFSPSSVSFKIYPHEQLLPILGSSLLLLWVLIIKCVHWPSLSWENKTEQNRLYLAISSSHYSIPLTLLALELLQKIMWTRFLTAFWNLASSLVVPCRTKLHRRPGRHIQWLRFCLNSLHLLGRLDLFTSHMSFVSSPFLVSLILGNPHYLQTFSTMTSLFHWLLYYSSPLQIFSKRF